MTKRLCMITALVAALPACLHQSPDGLTPSKPASVVVEHDFERRPLPRIPLPNDVATRFDATSPTGRRINASLIAPTSFERLTRQLVDTLDGWGTYMPITVPFTGELDVQSIIDRHHHDDYATADDVMYVIDIDPDSPAFGELALLDLGQGNFPQTLRDRDGYWEGDARGDTLSLYVEEHNEDLNDNGILDLGEDTDLDGVLDLPNYLPGVADDYSELTLSERSRALMTFYERESTTLIARLLKPLRERTRYAVVITRRLLAAGGDPVGSPYAGINHNYHSDALSPLEEILKGDAFGALELDEVAFAWTFTTGTIQGELRAVRDGLYGHGTQAQLAASYPPNLTAVHELWSRKPNYAHESPFTLSVETFRDPLAGAIQAGLVNASGKEYEWLMESLGFVDYYVMGSFDSPQLFERFDEEGRMLDWNAMHWPADITENVAQARREKVTFWMSIPRKEVSNRGDGQPADVVVLGHGYTSNKSEMIEHHGYSARRGMATIIIENVSHGLDLSDAEEVGLNQIFGLAGIEPFGEHFLTDRGLDFDGDGRSDSAADFWTAYTFHTRDVVRQSAVDYMQLLRIMSTWDGTKTWPFDTNGNGLEDDLAGDFDGDGVVDVSTSGEVSMTGGSLGGIMSAMMGGIEPKLDAVVPVAGGAGLSDIGVRSLQGGVRESVQLRIMGPLITGAPQDDGAYTVNMVVPDLNSTGRIPVSTIPSTVALAPGDSLRVDNLDHGEYDCALVQADGQFRLGVAADVDEASPQRLRVRMWHGHVFDPKSRDERTGRACGLLANAGPPIHVVDRFDREVRFHYRTHPIIFQAGDHLAPISDGLGLKRATPALRRFIGFAQLVLEPGDPINYASHYKSGEMTFATGEVVDTNALVVNTIGDMTVPTSTGVNIARAAGLIDHQTKVNGWGDRTMAQVLIDTASLEGVNNVAHYTSADGEVLFDLEDLSDSASSTADRFDWSIDPTLGPIQFGSDELPIGADGYAVPRLSPKLHEIAVTQDDSGGFSGLFFPFIKPEGQHGPDSAGYHTGLQIQWCIDAGGDSEACAAEAFYDNGAMVLGVVTRYLASGGKTFEVSDCMKNFSCSDDTAPPAPR